MDVKCVNAEISRRISNVSRGGASAQSAEPSKHNVTPCCALLPSH